MTLEALNSAAPLHPHSTDFDDYYFAGCLIALSPKRRRHLFLRRRRPCKKADKTLLFHTTTASCNCTLCGKFFSPRRALRRHKASHHSKPPTTVADGGEPSNSTSTAGTGASESISGSHRHHKCSTCGQALGGHKRKHYGGVIRRNGGRKIRLNSSDGGTVSTDVSSSSDGDMVPIARNLELKSPSPDLDLMLKL